MNEKRKQKYKILKDFEEQINSIKKTRKKLRLFILSMTLVTLLIMSIITGTINIALIPVMTLTTVIELLIVQNYTECQICDYTKIKNEQIKIINEEIEEKRKEEKDLTLNNYYHNIPTKEKVKIKK